MVCFIKNLKQYDICCNFALSQSSSGEHNQHRINLKKHQEYWTQNEKRPNDLLEAHSLTSTSWHEVKAMEPRSRQCSTLTQNQPQRSKYLHALCISGLVKSLDDLVQSTPILKPSSNGWNSKTDKVQILFFNLGEGYSSSFSITYYTHNLLTDLSIIVNVTPVCFLSYKPRLTSSNKFIIIVTWRSAVFSLSRFWQQ